MTVFGMKGRIHPAGWLFIGLGSAVTLGLSFLSSFLMGIGLILTLWCLYFFRDPERIPPQRESIILSPADGLVKTVTRALPPPELHLPEQEWVRISIFLNIFDVHIQRIPLTGVIEQCIYRPGKFFNASLDKASDLNERQTLLITAPQGAQIICVQIAGLIARRIICDVTQGQSVTQGAQYGMIRFGSRVDIYLPLSFSILVSPGQRMIGGETVLAEIPHASKENIR